MKKIIGVVFVPVVLSVIASAIYDAIKGLPWLSTLMTIMNKLWNFIIWLLSLNLRLWWIILVIILSFIIFWVAKIFIEKEPIEKETIEKEPPRPDYYNYNQDTFRLWIWRWEWYWNNDVQEWQINYLKPFCPTCDVELVHRENTIRQTETCPKCRKIYDSDYREIENEVEIRTLILDNIRKNKY